MEGQLRSAVSFGNVARVRALIAGASATDNAVAVSSLDRYRRNVLHIAAEREFIDEGSRLEMFRLLLQAVAAAADPAAVVNAPDVLGFTPMHLLCANGVGGTAAAVAVLLESGADPCARTDGGRRPTSFTRRADVRAMLMLASAEEGNTAGQGSSWGDRDRRHVVSVVPGGGMA